jgi:hypothetical protein
VGLESSRNKTMQKWGDINPLQNLDRYQKLGDGKPAMIRNVLN